MPKEYLPYIAPLVVVAIIAFRMSRSMKGRRVTPSLLWVRPAIIGVLLVFLFAAAPKPSLFGIGLFALAAMLGAGVGYLMSRHQELSLDPATGAITSKMSPVGMFLFLGVFAARYAFRAFVTGGQAPDKLAAHSAQITMYSDAALLFIFAVLAAQAWEIWRRTRPLVQEHAARTAARPAGN